MRRVLRAPALLGLLLTATVHAAPTPGQQAVATAHPLATAAAHRILDEGGNAFDAAVAAASTLGVVEPYGSGLGGGGFFLLRKADGADISYRFVDARETAPIDAGRDLFRDEAGKVQRDPAINGPLAAGIPGLPAALVYLAEHYGKLPLSQSLAPAIEAATKGFAVTSRYRALGGFRLEAMRRDAETARLFLRDNELPAEGTLIQQTELAATLRAMAEQGRDGFYRGPVAERMLASVQEGGGVWQQADLDEYRIIEREPLRFTSHGYEVISSPLPSAGGIALAGILQGLERLPTAQPGSVAWTHNLVELMRRTYRDRAMLLGDSDFVEVPVAQLVSTDYAQQLADEVRPDRATPSQELGAPKPFSEGTNTTHFSLLDKDGNAVAATLSINLPFGAAYTVPGTGILLNNEMDDFAADPSGVNEYGLAGGEVNAIAPGKRPLSSMTPTMLENDTQLAVLGTPGGSRIITMVLLSSLEAAAGEAPEQWVTRPRFHHQYLPDRIQAEDAAFTTVEKSELEALGHRVETAGRDYGDMQALSWDKQKGEVSAASDPRGVGESLVKHPVKAD